MRIYRLVLMATVGMFIWAVASQTLLAKIMSAVAIVLWIIVVLAQRSIDRENQKR